MKPLPTYCHILNVVIGYSCFQLEYVDNSSIRRHNRTSIGIGLSVFQYGVKQRKLYIGSLHVHLYNNDSV